MTITDINQENSCLIKEHRLKKLRTETFKKKCYMMMMKKTIVSLFKDIVKP